MSDEKRTVDLLYGAPAIAAYLGMGERQARYLMEKGTLPSFKIGGKVCASRSVVDEWLERQQIEARRTAAQKGGQ